MKRLILIGGMPWSGSRGRALVERMLSATTSNQTIAVCGFAVPEAGREAVYDYQITQIQKYSDAELRFVLLTRDNFVEQSKQASVIYIPGGDPVVLQAELNRQDGLAELWDGKTIAGSSAGADVLCQNYVHLQTKRVERGMGWLDINFLPHWQNNFENNFPSASDWDAIIASLREVSPLPVLGLSEGEFAEFIV